jgi:chromosome segregation ATPase
LKFLFGTLTQSDAQKYTEHIQRLESEQQSFLRVSQEQMTVLKSAILSFNITMQKVNKNERILNENLLRLSKMVVEEMNNIQTQIDSVMMLNENIQQVQRGLEECQHTLGILVDAFLHAQDGVIQPQLITIAKLRDMMRKESLPDGLDFPSFSILEL